MKKVKVSFKGNVVKTFNLDSIEILQVREGSGFSSLRLEKRSPTGHTLIVTSDIIPDVSFLDKIEIIEE